MITKLQFRADPLRRVSRRSVSLAYQGVC